MRIAAAALAQAHHSKAGKKRKRRKAEQLAVYLVSLLSLVYKLSLLTVCLLELVILTSIAIFLFSGNRRSKSPIHLWSRFPSHQPLPDRGATGPQESRCCLRPAPGAIRQGPPPPRPRRPPATSPAPPPSSTSPPAAGCTRTTSSRRTESTTQSG